MLQLWSIDITNCPPQFLGCDAWLGGLDHLHRDPLLARRDGGPPGQTFNILMFQQSWYRCGVVKVLILILVTTLVWVWLWGNISWPPG